MKAANAECSWDTCFTCNRLHLLPLSRFEYMTVEVPTAFLECVSTARSLHTWRTSDRSSHNRPGKLKVAGFLRSTKAHRLFPLASSLLRQILLWTSDADYFLQSSDDTQIPTAASGSVKPSTRLMSGFGILSSFHSMMFSESRSGRQRDRLLNLVGKFFAVCVLIRRLFGVRQQAQYIGFRIIFVVGSSHVLLAVDRSLG